VQNSLLNINLFSWHIRKQLYFPFTLGPDNSHDAKLAKATLSSMMSQWRGYSQHRKSCQ